MLQFSEGSVRFTENRLWFAWLIYKSYFHLTHIEPDPCFSELIEDK